MLVRLRLLPPTEGGLYWSGNTRALALFGHAERMLTSDDPSERNAYWSQLRHAAFKATELPIEREQADQRYRQRVELALQAEPDLPGVDSTNAIVDAQLAHYNWLNERNEAGVQGSARLEVARIIEQASRWSPDVERVALELGADASPLEAAEHELRIALEAVADRVPRDGRVDVGLREKGRADDFHIVFDDGPRRAEDAGGGGGKLLHPGAFEGGVDGDGTDGRGS